MKNKIPENKILIDPAYGSGIAFAVQGEDDFINEWVNFALNMGVVGKWNEPLESDYFHREEGTNFGYFVTSIEKLEKAFVLENQCRFGVELETAKQMAQRQVEAIERSDFMNEIKGRFGIAVSSVVEQ